jgi:phytanoyl-CoA hydroxylase
MKACAASTAAPTSILSQQQKEQYEKDGFLVIKGFSSVQEMNALQSQMKHLVEAFDPSSVSVFTTKNQAAKTDKYFLDSASNVSFFFEENAFDADGQLRQPKGLSLNKVGHALHDVDPVFRPFSRSEGVAAVLRDLGYERPIPMQSQYIFKQPHIGGEVVPHQDSTFLYTTPRQTCVALWWAIEAADEHNGCLWAAPEVHKAGLLRQFILKEDGAVVFDNPAPKYDLSNFVPLNADIGDLVILHGENIHYSCANSSPDSRHSYIMHMVEGTEDSEWSPMNWLQRNPSVPLEPFYES